MRGFFATAGAAIALSAAPAAGETLKAVPKQLNPAKAYILVEYKLQANPLAGFPGSRKTIPLMAGLVFARYDAERSDVRGMGKAAAHPLPPKQVAIEGFRNRPLVKSKDARLFLIEVEPDLWVVQGFGSTSFSLGSYMFQLDPGTVTDLGVVSAEADWAEGDTPPNAGHILGAALAGPFAKRPDVAPARVTFRPRASGDIPVPAGPLDSKVRPVSFTPGAKFGNYLGGLVNRIEGVNHLAKVKASSSGSPEDSGSE
jgi:hypothetical protein